MIVVVCKLMFNMDLIVGVKKINIEKIVNIMIGCFGIFLNCLQLNYLIDNVDGIMVLVMEGFFYGVGDVLIGLNFVDDFIESVKWILNKFEEFCSEWEILI